MTNIASELFLLTTHLAQLKNRASIVSIFIDGINQIYKGCNFKWINDIQSNVNNSIAVCTRTRTFGRVLYSEGFNNLTEEFSFFQNATQMLAILLENFENENLLNDQKQHLQHLVEEQTRSIFQKQDELNEINEEYATLNEELLYTNQTLLQANQSLEKEIRKHEITLEELKRSENYFKNIFNHSAVGKSITTIDGILQVNQSFCEILGYSQDELLNINWKRITHPDDIEANEKILNEILAGKYSKASWQKRYIHKNGNIVWVNINSALQRDAENNPLYYITTIIDITSQIETQEKLRESTAYLETLFNYSNVPIIVWDSCFVVLRFNKAFEKLSGYKAKDVIGKNIDFLFSKETIDLALEYLSQTHEGTRLEGIEIDIIQKDGTRLTLLWHSAAIYSQDGKEIVATIAVGNNITEIKQAIKKIRLGEKRLASIIDGTQAGTWEWNIQRGLTIFNEKWAGIIGYTLNELEPVSIDTWIKFAHPDDLMRSNELLDRHFKGELEYYENESRMLHKDGHWVWVLDRGKVTSWNEEGEPVWMSGTHQDITERKKAEIALKDSEHLLNQSQRISLIGSYTLDFKEGFWRSSEILDQIFGIEPTDDHSIEGWINLVHPDDREMMSKYFMNEVVGKKGRFDKEYRIVSANNKKVKWVHGIGELELNYQGEAIRMIGTIQDITERKIVSNALYESNELLSQFVLHSPIYAFIKEVTPSESRVVKASENYMDMIGIPGSQMEGKNMFELFPKNLATKMTEDDWNVISNGSSLKLEEELKNRYYTTIKFPIKLGNKHLLAGYTIDNTEQKQSELLVKLKNEELIVTNQKLKKAKEKAEESDRLKTSFLTNMSHEIRTPLNSIMGFASLLPDEDQKKLIDQYAQIIVSNSEQLLSIIDGIVLYSKLQTGLMVCNKSEFELQAVCADILQSFNLPAYIGNVSLIIDPGNDTSISVFTDYDKLRQILANLVSNAFKYTINGQITLSYSSLKDHIQFKVNDTGIGIPVKEKKHIFDRFYRGSNVEQSSMRGTGLGLSIVKELVELLGGSIGVKSKLGVGSTFYFTISRN